MSRLTIPYSRCSCREEAYGIVKREIPRILSKWKLAADLDLRDAEHQIHAKGKGFTMDIDFEEKQAVAELSLSFPLSALKKTILPPLEREFSKHL